MNNVSNFESIKEENVKLGLEVLKFDIDINTRPNEEKDEVAKKNFTVLWKRYVMQFPNTTCKQYVLEDFKVKVGKESYLYPACGGHSLRNETNDKGDLALQKPCINIRTFIRSPGNHLTTKYISRYNT